LRWLKASFHVIADLGDLRGQFLQVPLVALGLVVGGLGRLVGQHHLVDCAAGWDMRMPRSCRPTRRLLDGVGERALHLLAHLVELAVLVLELAEELLGLLFVLVLLGVVDLDNSSCLASALWCGCPTA